MTTGNHASTGLPAALYARPEAFQRERRTVFANAWLLLGRAASLRMPGDYMAATLGGWPVFAMADQFGAPGAFRNICRHQGLPLFDSGAGQCEQIRCRYHGWTYDTAGRFVAAPPKVAPPDPGNSLHSLERVGAAGFQGLLFVHLGAAPPPLETALNALVPALTAAHFSRLGFHGETVTDIDANWKIVVELFLGTPPDNVTRTLQWPCVVLDRFPDGVIIHQIVARAFQRSRIVHYRYVAAGIDAAHNAEGAARSRADMETVETGALAVQAALEAGATPAIPETPGLAEFRARIREAHPAAGQ